MPVVIRGRILASTVRRAAAVPCLHSVCADRSLIHAGGAVSSPPSRNNHCIAPVYLVNEHYSSYATIGCMHCQHRRRSAGYRRRRGAGFCINGCIHRILLPLIWLMPG